MRPTLRVYSSFLLYAVNETHSACLLVVSSLRRYWDPLCMFARRFFTSRFLQITVLREETPCSYTYRYIHQTRRSHNPAVRTSNSFLLTATFIWLWRIYQNFGTNTLSSFHAQTVSLYNEGNICNVNERYPEFLQHRACCKTKRCKWTFHTQDLGKRFCLVTNDNLVILF